MDDWQGFYSTSQVARLAQIPRRTLYDWKARGIIAPSVRVMDGELVVDEGYSYADLTIIRIMRALREKQLDLKSVGIALRHLYERLGPPSLGWADSQVHIVGNHIFAYQDDEWETTAATRFGQKIDTRLFGELFEDLRNYEEPGSILVPIDFTEYVEIDPNVMGGQPVVRGTRVPTSLLAQLSAQGKPIREIAQLYQPIPQNAVLKAIEYERFLDRAA